MLPSLTSPMADCAEDPNTRWRLLSGSLVTGTYLPIPCNARRSPERMARYLRSNAFAKRLITSLTEYRQYYDQTRRYYRGITRSYRSIPGLALGVSFALYSPQSAYPPYTEEGEEEDEPEWFDDTPKLAVWATICPSPQPILGWRAQAETPSVQSYQQPPRETGNTFFP